MLFRIHRMRESARDSFRWAPHTSGAAVVKPKDYEPAGETEGATPYAAWSQLRASERPLQTGDILEDESGKLHIAKYIGFEAAQWWVPDPKPVAIAPEASAPPAAAVSGAEPAADTGPSS